MFDIEFVCGQPIVLNICEHALIVHCPVCREVFWSRYYRYDDPGCLICMKLRKRLESQNKKSALEQSRFCVVHGLVTPESIPVRSQ